LPKNADVCLEVLAQILLVWAIIPCIGMGEKVVGLYGHSSQQTYHRLTPITPPASTHPTRNAHHAHGRRLIDLGTALDEIATELGITL
jgi:hypothetical protein